MDDKITLDRDAFRALAADTRVEILKTLDDRKHTLTDLSKKLKLAPSTLKEHVDRLIKSNLIYHEDKGTKWKYYKLTQKGRSLLHPHETRIWVMLATSVLGLGVVAAGLLRQFGALAGKQAYAAAPAAEAVRGGAENEFAVKAVHDAAEAATQTPHLELALAIALALTAGACAGYLIRRKAAL